MILPERTGHSCQEHHENAQGEEHEMVSNKVKAGKHRVWRPLMGPIVIALFRCTLRGT